MLRIEMDEAALNWLQKSALESGGQGVGQAMTIRAIRMALENMVDGFNRVQQRAARTKPELVIGDGQIDNIRQALSLADGPFSWPSKSGRLLQSLNLAKPLRRDGARSPGDYLCKLTIGPPQARRFGSYCAIFAYRHTDTCGRIVWIGLESAFAEGLKSIASAWPQQRANGPPPRLIEP